MNASPVIVHFEFAFPGPFGTELEAGVRDLARSINEEPGFIWKVWTEDASAKQAGGVYLFEDRASADAYIAKHTARLGQLGVSEVRVKMYDVNTGLTRLNHGPLTPQT